MWAVEKKERASITIEAFLFGEFVTLAFLLVFSLVLKLIFTVLMRISMQTNFFKKCGVGLGIVILLPLSLHHIWGMIDLFRGQSYILDHLKGSFLFDIFSIVKFGLIMALIFGAIIRGSKMNNDQLGGALILGTALFVAWFGYFMPGIDILQQDIAVLGTCLFLIGVGRELTHK